MMFHDVFIYPTECGLISVCVCHVMLVECGKPSNNKSELKMDITFRKPVQTICETV
jgi:hypothetical protein